MTRILLTGTGVTSAITGSILKQELPKAELIFWDKAQGTGGRMSTFRNSKDSTSTLDLGAQYITTTSDYADLHNLYYQDLKEAGILVPLTAKVGGMKTAPEGAQHYVTPHGISSLVKHFLLKSNSEIKFKHHIENINSVGKQWEVRTQTGVKDCFDLVILTMPVPQILGLSGQVQKLIETQNLLHKNLKCVEYSSRYAIGLFYNKEAQISLRDGNCAEYISNDPIIRFVSIDNLKRGRDDLSPSVVAHTSVPFGKANVEKTPAEVEPCLVSKIKEMFPHWPDPQSVKCQKWRYSQVTSAYPGLPGAVEIGEGLLAGGDGFTHSNLDGCIESAKALASVVIQYVSKL